MAARSTLNQLIDRLRSLTQAGTADWTLGTATFWDSDHMQQVLDRNRRDIYREQLYAIPFHPGGGSVQYFEYASEWVNFEQTDGGTALFYVEDSTGANKGTATWTADYLRGRVTFGADQKGTVYYLTGRIFDLNGSAAEIWQSKADRYGQTNFDWSTDNMSVKRGQSVTNAVKMADHYASMAWPKLTEVFRGDER